MVLYKKGEPLKFKKEIDCANIGTPAFNKTRAAGNGYFP